MCHFICNFGDGLLRDYTVIDDLVVVVDFLGIFSSFVLFLKQYHVRLDILVPVFGHHLH